MPVTPQQHASYISGIGKARSSYKLPSRVVGAAEEAMGNIKRNVSTFKTNVRSGSKKLKTAVANNKQTNGGRFKPFSLKGTY